jgi:hypothetical protein
MSQQFRNVMNKMDSTMEENQLHILGLSPKKPHQNILQQNQIEHRHN